jgi:hypothetical protein
VALLFLLFFFFSAAFTAETTAAADEANCFPTTDLVLHWGFAELYIVFDGAPYRSVEPQRDLGAQASPSRTRSSDHEVTTQTLDDDARTATPSPAADARTATPLSVADAGAQCSIGDIGASTSPPVITMDPINMMPGALDQDLLGTQLKLSRRRRIQRHPVCRYRVHHRQG